MLSFKLFRSLNLYIRKRPSHCLGWRKKKSYDAQTAGKRRHAFLISRFFFLFFFYESPEMHNAGENGINHNKLYLSKTYLKKYFLKLKVPGNQIYFFCLKHVNIFSLFRLKLKISQDKLIDNSRNEFYLVWKKD